MTAHLSPRQLADMLNIKLCTLAEWRTRGSGPAYQKVGRLVRYHPDDVHEWLKKNRRTGTGQHG